MKPSLIVITRGAIYLIGLAVMAVCGVLLPELAREEAVGKANLPPAYPYLIGAWIVSLPIFIGLYQTHKLLGYIIENKVFSNRGVKAVQNIKYCSTAFSILIALGAITVIVLSRMANPTEEVTHIITLGFIFTFISSIITTFIAVLQRLLQEAVKIKSENDLII